jgi:formylmethanofuran dehydrogenase subunit B
MRERARRMAITDRMPLLHSTCPFCGLLCDDLEIDADGLALRPARGACARSRSAFASLGTTAAAQAQARVDGAAVSMETALDAAARLLRAAHRPLVAGLDVDVGGMRAVLDLARRCGAVVDHVASAAKYRNLHVLQEAGWITTTLAEARNRADLFVLVGDAWHARFPRFLERIVAPGSDMFGPPAVRRIVLLTEDAVVARGALPEGVECLPVGLPRRQLPVAATMLAAMLDGRPVDPGRLGMPAGEALARCAGWMRAARYGVVVWAAGDLELPHAELAVQALMHCVRVLNATTRFAALPLAGTDGDFTANAVQTWQSGVSYPASYANGRVDFDPWRHGWRRVLEDGEADLLFWVSSLGLAEVPATGGIPCVVLGRADRQAVRAAEVFIPVATPGVDATGHVVRSDKVVTLRLPRLREAALPTVATAVGALLERLR